MRRASVIYLFAVLLTVTLTFMSAGGAKPTVYDLSWHSIDGGGGHSSGGAFDLAGTIGQPDAGAASGGAFAVVGGFWTAADVTPAPTCLADVSGDGFVDVADLLALLSAWGACDTCDEDIDGSGAVDVADLLELLSAWGPCS